jgi:hypothetical protein
LFTFDEKQLARLYAVTRAGHMYSFRFVLALSLLHCKGFRRVEGMT